MNAKMLREATSLFVFIIPVEVSITIPRLSFKGSPFKKYDWHALKEKRDSQENLFARSTKET